MIKNPLVTCITPTANRQKYLPLAIQYFLNQDYSNAEMVIIDDGINSAAALIPEDPRIKYYYYPKKIGTIGVKRNLACEKAKGDIIVHWDDDDWYASDWISRHVEAQLTSSAEITGLNTVTFYSPSLNIRWKYEDLESEKPWLCGATIAFKKSLWKKYNFTDLQIGEDNDFVWNSNGKVLALDYTAGFVSILHAHNTSLKKV